MTLTFTKMNGAGNDFVVIDNRLQDIHLMPIQIAHLCDRHRGIGADGLLLVETAQQGADFRMRYYNSDGGEAEMCGNGARCFARFAAGLAGSSSTSVSFETQAGIIRATLFDDLTVELQMSTPHSLEEAEILLVEDLQQTVSFLNTGVPHAVVFVEDLQRVNVAEAGRVLRNHPHFAPSGTNVNFVTPIASSEIAIRTYERGVEAETLACGTGVVASALLFHLQTNAPSPVAVHVQGGDTLTVRFTETDRGVFPSVFLRGPADIVFSGTITI